jgi:hypothetical protein
MLSLIYVVLHTIYLYQSPILIITYNGVYLRAGLASGVIPLIAGAHWRVFEVSVCDHLRTPDADIYNYYTFAYMCSIYWLYNRIGYLSCEQPLTATPTL